MNYWLMKTEPDEYSIDDLMRDKKEAWTGVRNFQARNYMRDEMKIGDLVLFYHSSVHPPGIAGIARVCTSPYPDPTAFDLRSPYFDPKSKKEKPTWFLIEIEFVKKLSHFIPLDRLKNIPELQEMRLLQKGNRLSVMPVEKKHIAVIERLLVSRK